MDFAEQKKRTLSRKDCSKKGSVDKAIRPLLDDLNADGRFYTTSSCAGRISAIALSKSQRKDESSWLYVTHEPASLGELKRSLKILPDQDVWFRMEPAILHVCCRDLKAAERLLILAKEAGFKHSGVLSLGRRIVTEIVGSEFMDTIIARDGKYLIDHAYLGVLVAIANEKLDKTRKRIKKLNLLLKGPDDEHDQ